MSGFLPPVVMKIMANGSQFLTESGRVAAAMDATAAKARLTAASEAASSKSAAAAAEQAAAAQALAADTAAKAAAVAADKTIAAQAKAAAATGESQAAAARAAELAAAKEAEAANKAAAAAQLAADKVVMANEKRMASDKAAAAEAALPAAGSGKTKFGMGGAQAAMAGGAIAAGLGAAAVYSLDQATKYQKEISLLQTAGGELASNMATVSSGILKVAAATGTSTQQLSEGMFTVEKAGFRGASGLNVLKAAAEGAKAENADMGTVTNALTSIMSSYHMKAGQATQATNMLVAGSGAAKTTMQEYAGSLSTVLPVASAAGISFAQVAGGIATLTQHGTSAQESTQELANTIRGLQAPNAVASKAMQQLGLNVTDVSTGLGKRGLTGTIEMITDKIASSLGPSGLVMVDTMKKSATATQDLQTMMGKMPAGMAASAKAFLDGTMSQKEFTKSYRDMGAQGAAQGRQFATLAKTVKGYNDQIKAGGPAAQTAAASLKAIMGGATGMNTALMLSSTTAKGGGENMAMFKSKVDEVAAAGKKGGADISTWAQTQSNLAVQMDKTKQSVEAAAISIGQKLAPAAKIVLGALQAVFGFITQHQTTTMILAVALGALATGLLIAAAAQWVMNSAMLANPLTWMIVIIVAVIAAVVLLVANWKNITAAITNIWAGFMGWIQGVLGGFAGWWSGVWSGILSFFKPLWNAIVAVVHGAWALIVNSVTTSINVVKTIIQTVWNIIKTIFQTAFQIILTVVVSAFAFLIAIFTGKFALAGQIVMTAWNTIVGLFTRAGVVILAYITVAWNTIVALIGGALDRAGSIISGGWNAIWGMTTSVFNNVMGFLGGVWGNIVDGGARMIGNLIGFFTGLPGRIMGALSGAGNWLYSVGQDIINGLISGVSSMMGSIGNAILSLIPGPIVGVFKKALGINSPSRVFRGFGQNIVEGLILGTGDKTDHLTSTMKSLVTVPPAPTMGASNAALGLSYAPEGYAGAGTVNNITVNAQTNADPRTIASDLGYQLRLMG